MEKVSKNIARAAGKVAKVGSRPVKAVAKVAKKLPVAKTAEEEFAFSQTKPNKVHEFFRKYSTPLIITLCLLVLASAATFLITKYNGRATPGTNIAGFNVSGQNAFAIHNTINDLENKIKLTLSHDGKTVDANCADLGINVDIDKTTEEALLTSNDWTNRLNVFGSHNVKLVASVDWSQTTKFLNENFPGLVTDPRDAGVVYNQNTSQFVTQASANGEVIDMTKIKQIVEDLIVRPRAAVASVALVNTPPPISDTAAQAAADYANARLGLRINLNSNGQTVYYADPSDIANWITFTPSGNNLNVSFDENKIKTFLSTTVANSLTEAPVDALAIVGSDGTILKQISAGKDGQTVGNVASLSGSIMTALANDTPVDLDITLTPKPFTVSNQFVAADNHWAEVNLTTQYVTLWNGTTQVGYFIASSGVSAAPTPTGLYKVWLKVPSQTMSGGGESAALPAYNLPNVTWVSYFNQDIAFHTKYWNNIWGRPSSHGCINLHEADAKTVYDFVSIGTPVWVHY